MLLVFTDTMLKTSGLMAKKRSSKQTKYCLSDRDRCFLIRGSGYLSFLSNSFPSVPADLLSGLHDGSMRVRNETVVRW